MTSPKKVKKEVAEKKKGRERGKDTTTNPQLEAASETSSKERMIQVQVFVCDLRFSHPQKLIL